MVASAFAVLVLVDRYDPSGRLVGSIATVWTALGTLAAAYAALAPARSSERAAAEAREALARIVAPTLSPSVHTEGDISWGRISPDGSGAGAVDVTAVWTMRSGEVARREGGTLQGWRADLPPGSDITFKVQLPSLVKQGQEADLVAGVVVEYTDERRLQRWRQAWEVHGNPIGSMWVSSGPVPIH